MGAQLKNPPVYLTLAQVRFNAILKLADFLPSIQECFRRSGYPDFNRQPIFTVHLTTQEGQPPTPTPVQHERFLLGNVEKTHLFILDGQSLTLQSTDYGHFENFSECFLKGLNIVNDAVNLAFTERIGLRYLDRIMPQSTETIEQYLAEQVQGLNSRLGGRSLYTYTEAMNEIGEIKLISRVSIQTGQLAIPPDIQIGNMRISERFTLYDGVNAILDNDGFVETREVFSMEAVEAHLKDIHKIIGAAFEATVTEHAFIAWGK